MSMEKQIMIATAQFSKLSARMFGTEGKPVVVLVHGFPADGAMWREIVPLLAADFQVLVPDLPGVGNSSFQGEEISIEELADSIAALIDHLQIRKSVIAGHSMGGYIALAFAARYPEKLNGLSLIHSTAKADDNEKKNGRRKSIELIRKGGREAFIEASVPPLFADAFQKAHPEVMKVQQIQAMQVNSETLIAFYNAMINRPDRLDVLVHTAFPVQWIIGAQDGLIPPRKVLQQTILANVNFVMIYPNSGHMSMLEEPQQLAHDIVSFLTYCNARQTEDLLV